MKRWACLEENKINRELPENNIPEVAPVCGKRCDESRQNKVGAEGLCASDNEACCRYSGADKFTCMPIGTAHDFPGNEAPNCLSDPCDAKLQNKPNADGTKYCCAKNCLDKTEYGWVAQGSGYRCGTDPTNDTKSDNENVAPYCLREVCDAKAQNKSNSDGSSYCCAQNCDGELAYGWVTKGQGYVCGSSPLDTLTDNGNQSPTCKPCKCSFDEKSKPGCLSDEFTVKYVKRTLGIDIPGCEKKETCEENSPP